jgi:gamma-glutamyltranspeptidase/glutathione hydrolase
MVVFARFFARHTRIVSRGALSTFIALLLASHAGAVPAEGTQIMYAGPSPAAVEVVKEIHRRGGNVVDAAVGAALSMAVTSPYFASLGGGGFAVVKIGKEVKALDFREMAPAKANPDLYKDKGERASLDGGLAVGVPGIAMGLFELHKKYGKLKWNQLFSAPIKTAEQGFNVSGEWVAKTSRSRKRFSADHLKMISDAKGEALKPGAVWKQPGLAKLMRLLRDKGAKAFYEGDVAKDIADTVNKTGGIFSTQDLANYKARWLEPLTVKYSGYTLHLMPPPSSGGVLIAEAVQLMEKLKLDSYATLSVDELHLLIEIMKMSFKARVELGDPDFVKNPIAEILNDESISKLAAQIKLDKAAPVETLKALPKESTETTHFSVMDGAGNSVAITVTLNGDWGAALISPKYGVALNNEMDDFTTRPGKPNLFGLIQGKANEVKAGARPLSSMSPTIIEKDGRTIAALGSPGGPRIITAVMQVIYRVLRGPYDIDEAIQAPRVHHQYMPDRVAIDRLKLPPETIAALEKRGHTIQPSSTAKVYGIVRTDEGVLEGAADARGEAAAGGY